MTEPRARDDLAAIRPPHAGKQVLKVVRQAEALRRLILRHRAAGAVIGFVPTMGSLHEGHLQLVRRAIRENDVTVASIFVNPLQFGPGEDFDAYPRTPANDRSRLRREGVHYSFEPGREFYPVGFQTLVSVRDLSRPLCGPFRPGHFDGVATVVTKLLLAALPDCLYLGQKDYQQAMLLRRLVRDLNLGLRLVVCPTVRESDGLAMSSRNAYLTPEERERAPEFARALRATAKAIRSGEIREASEARRRIRQALRHPSWRLQYADVLQAETLAEVSPLRGRLVVAAAVYLGRTRLIDNVLVRAPGTGKKGTK